MRLNREGPTLELDTLLVASEGRQGVLTLRFNEVTDLQLGGFNEQNVLFDLTLERGTDGSYEVTLQSSYGLSGTFRCSGISVAE